MAGLVSRLETQIQYVTSKMEECPENSPMHSYYAGMLEAYNDCLNALDVLQESD